MECPYCHKEMQKGVIPGRDVIWWRPEGSDPLAPESGVRLSEANILYAVEAESFYCADCRVVLTPVKEFETISDKLHRKWNSFTDAVSKKKDLLMAEREVQTRRQRSEKRRKKDPWEVD